MFFLFGFPFVFFFPIFVIFLVIRAGLSMSSPNARGRCGGIGSVDDEQDIIAQLHAGGYSYRHMQATQAQLFKLAYRIGGRLTVSDIVIESGLGVQEAEQLIESMVDNTHVRMEVDDDGMVVYDFPEIIARRKRMNQDLP